MKWFWFPIAVAAIAIFFFVVWLVPSATNWTKPARADCIAGAQLFWPTSTQNRAEVLNQIANLGPVGGLPPTAGLSIRDTQRIYVIFFRDCDQREKMMEEVMQGYKDKISEFPDFQVFKERIEPSPDTIQVYGEHWSDGEMPEGVFEDSEAPKE